MGEKHVAQRAEKNNSRVLSVHLLLELGHEPVGNGKVELLDLRNEPKDLRLKSVFHLVLQVATDAALLKRVEVVQGGGVVAVAQKDPVLLCGLEEVEHDCLLGELNVLGQRAVKEEDVLVSASALD